MNGALLLKGLGVGFSIAAPVGPIGILCIRRSLADGPLVGFICGLGAATADALYALLGGIALTTVTQLLLRARLGLLLTGGVFLVYLGVRTLLATRRGVAALAASAMPRASSALAAYVSTLALTLANPLTVLSFAAVFAGLGAGLLAGPGRYAATSSLVLGVFIGSALWWLLLSLGVGRLRWHLNATLLHAIDTLCGLILLVFGLYALASGAQALSVHS